MIFTWILRPIVQLKALTTTGWDLLCSSIIAIIIGLLFGLWYGLMTWLSLIGLCYLLEFFIRFFGWHNETQDHK